MAAGRASTGRVTISLHLVWCRAATLIRSRTASTLTSMTTGAMPVPAPSPRFRPNCRCCEANCSTSCVLAWTTASTRLTSLTLAAWTCRRRLARYSSRTARPWGVGSSGESVHRSHRKTPGDARTNPAVQLRSPRVELPVDPQRVCPHRPSPGPAHGRTEPPMCAFIPD